MPQSQEEPIRKRGGHLKRNETKSIIIEYILSNNGNVRREDIVGNLNKKYAVLDYEGIKDKGGINKQLHDLREEGCIELFQAATSKYKQKSGLPNEWNITRIRHLKNIREKTKEENCFKEIKLNSYEKSIKIILYESGYDVKSLKGLENYFYLLFSISFFDMCIDVGIKTLLSRAWEIYISEKGLNQYQSLINDLDNSRTAYNKRCKIKVPEKSFRKMMKTMILKEKKISSLEMFVKMWEKRFQGMSEEDPRGFTKEDLLRLSDGKYPTQSKEEFLELLRKLEQSYPKVDEEDLEIYREMYRIMLELRDLYTKFKLDRFDLLVWHFLYHDMYNGVGSTDLNVMRMIKNNHEEARRAYYDGEKDREKVLRKLMIENLEQVYKLIVKYKQPSEFSSIYNNPKSNFQDLKEFFGWGLE